MKRTVCFIIVFICSYLTHAQKSLKNDDKVVIKGSVPVGYNKDNIELESMTMGILIGFRPDLIQQTNLNIEKGNFACDIHTSEPLLVRISVF